MGSLAKALKMSVLTIPKVIEGKTVKTERKSERNEIRASRAHYTIIILGLLKIIESAAIGLYI